MERIKKGSRWGFELGCSCCGTTLFRTQKDLDSRPLHFCRTCAAAKATYMATGSTIKHSQNNSFFKETSLNTFYWAGFIAADGYVNEKKNYIQIKLTESDNIQLETFLGETNSSNQIFTAQDRSGFEGGKNRYRIVIRNKDWVKDLKEKFNIVQCKSLTHEPPNTEGWTKEQTKAFIIGYLDGDGTICYIGTDKYLKLGFIGTFEFLNWIKDFITSEYEISLTDKSIQHKKTCVNKNVHELVVYGTKALKVLIDLKQLPIYKLERKWSKV